MVQLPLCFKASATQSGTTTGTFGLNGPYCIERVSLPSLSLSLSLSLCLSHSFREPYLSSYKLIALYAENVVRC